MIHHIIATTGVAVAFSLLIGCAGAPGDTTDPSEWDTHWKCEGLSLYASKYFGKVVADNIEEITDFRIDGLARRWNWGCDGNGCKYSVILKRDTATYYHFLEGEKTAKPSAWFHDCIEGLGIFGM